MDPRELAAKLTEDEQRTLVDLPQWLPWSMGRPHWKDCDHREKFRQLGLVEAIFPEAKPGNSGPQLWRWNQAGLDVRGAILQETTDG